MSINNKLNELKPQDLNCNVFSVYDYSGLSMQELLCKFFTKINECVGVCNDTIELTNWLLNEGLSQEVVKKLMTWLEDGTLENLINKSLFDSKVNKTKLEVLSCKMTSTGDCMLIKTNNGKTILCDTGSSSQLSTVDNFLNKNITKLDYLIITHYHSDHIGNLEHVLKNYTTTNTKVILPCEPNFSKFNVNGQQFKTATQNVYTLCSKYGLNYKIPTEGEELEIDDITLKFINCSLELFENYYNTQSEFYSDGSTDYNNFSLVFELLHNNVKMLFTADINEKAQECIMPYIQKYDLFKCHHHSVDTHSHIPFMDKVFPEMAFTNNNGQDSLPKSEVSRYLLSRGIPYYVTHQSGDLKFISDGFNVTTKNKTYRPTLNMKEFLNTFGVSNYMYYGFGDITKEYTKNPSTISLEKIIKEMVEGSCASVNFNHGYNVTPSDISSFGGSGFIQKMSANKATIILYDNDPSQCKCYVGLWHSSYENVMWHRLANDIDVKTLQSKTYVTTYATYGNMSSLGVTTSSTALDMVKKMPACSLYSGYVTQSFDNSKLDTYGGMVDIKKSSNNLIAKITLTTANPNNIKVYEGVYHKNVGDFINWKQIV